jgi:PAS domain S-box-containing protein
MLFAESPLAQHVSDCEGRIRYANTAMCRLLGYADSSLVGRPVWDLFAPEEREIRRVEALARLKNDAGTLVFDRTLNRSDASQVYVEIHERLVRNSEGELYLHTTLIDRTRRRRRKGERHRLSQVARLTQTSVIIMDSRGRVEWVNGSFTKLTGYSKDEVLGREPVEFLYGPETDEKTAESLARCLEERRGANVEILYYRKDRTRIWVRVAIDPMFDDDGKLTGFVATQTDVTRCRSHEILSRSILQNTLSAIISLSLNGEIESMNPSAERLLGWSSADVVGRAGADLFLDNGEICRNAQRLGLEADFGALLRAVANGTSMEGEWTCIGREGSRTPVWLTISAMRDLQGHLTGYLLLARDLCAQVAAEQAREMAARRLTRIASQVPLILYQFEQRPDGRMFYPYISGQTMERFGMNADQLKQDARGVFRLVHPDDIQSLMAAREESARIMTDWQLEFRVTDTAGETRWILARSSPERLPDGGLLWSGCMADITETKLEELQSRKLAKVVEQAAEAVVITDLKGAIEYVNPAFEKVSGYSRDELLGRNPRVLSSGKQDAAFYAGMWSALKSKQVWLGRFVNRRKDGTEFHEDATLFAVVDDRGKVRNYVGIKRDVTHEVELEQARRLSEESLQRTAAELEKMVVQLRREKERAELAASAKSRFLSAMSHEIRTPMNGIIGMSSLLLEAGLSEEQRDYAEAVRSSAESLLTLLNDILDFSKIEAGKLAIESIEFDLERALEDVMELCSLSAQEKGLEFTLWYPPGLPRVFVGDPGRIRQVALNLVSNAIKFTDRGSIRLDISRSPAAQSGTGVTLSVRDTGIGIEATKINRLFEEFTQLDSSTTRRFGGTGLGLAITRSLVALMHGTISVESTPGEGSCFQVRLPVAGTTTEPVRQKFLPPLKVLICDKHPDARFVISEWCREFGLLPDAVGTTGDFFACLQSASLNDVPYSLGIVESGLFPDNGRRLPAMIAELSPVPKLIAITRVDQRGNWPALIDAGYSSCLMKAIRPHALKNAVDAACGSDPRGREDSELTRASDPGLLNGVRALVVDDNRINQRIASINLQRLACEVETASDGAEAIRKVTASRYDVILMDCHMPLMDGFEATRRIRKMTGPGAATPIIALTASAMAGDRDRCLQAGMDDYISKPINVGELRRVVEHWSVRRSGAAGIGESSHAPVPDNRVS